MTQFTFNIVLVNIKIMYCWSVANKKQGHLLYAIKIVMLAIFI